jgi:hypothetical protein
LEWALADLERLNAFHRGEIRAELDRREDDQAEDEEQWDLDNDEPASPPPKTGGTIDKDDVLPLVTRWYDKLLAAADPAGKVPVKRAHAELLDALGLARFEPVA